MKKAYEVTYKDGNELKTATVKGFTLIGALVTWKRYPDVYDNLVSINELRNYIMTVRFWNIKSKTTNGIKYSSKLISVVNPIIENGRIHAADILEVMLTESDYARYKKLYTWDDMEIIKEVKK